MEVVIVVHGQADLFKVVLTPRAVRGLPNFLDRRQQQSHQDSNNGNDDEQLDERKGAARPPAAAASDQIM
jgi:hypothetical protein